VPVVLNRLMMYSSLRWGQKKTRRRSERSDAHIRKGIAHDLQEFRLVNGVEARPHVQLDKVHLRAFDPPALNFPRKGNHRRLTAACGHSPHRDEVCTPSTSCVSHRVRRRHHRLTRALLSMTNFSHSFRIGAEIILSHMSRPRKSPVGSD